MLNFLHSWVVIPVLLVGCVSKPFESRFPDANFESPQAWHATREAKKGVDHNWVRTIGGSQLSGLVKEALDANPDMLAAASRVERASAEARIAGAARQPSLDAGGFGLANQQRFIGIPIPSAGGGVPGAQFNNFGVSMNAAWELDVWGKLHTGRRVAITEMQAQRADLEAARVSLAGQVAKAWLALAESNEQVALAEEAIDARRILAQAVRERYERAIDEDGGSAAQVRLTESEVAVGEAILAERRQEKERAVRQLELLLGRYPSGKLVASAKLPSVPSHAPAGLPSELLMRRPDILAAERRLAAEGGRKRVAHLARFPSLTLTGSLGTTTDSLRNIANSDFGIWSIGGSITQPIFQGGRLAGELERAKADERRAIADLQRTVLNAFGEVEQALAAETFLRERESATARAAKLATDAAQRADEEFSAGTGDVLTLIETRKLQIDTASQLAAIRRLRIDQRIDLHLALGGGFKL